MTEHVPTKQVSLDELKRAVTAVEQAWADDTVSDYVAAALRAEAWRAAFEWRNGIEVRREQARSEGMIHSGALYGEQRDGLALIQEKLR